MFCRPSRPKTFTPWIFHACKRPSIPPGSGAETLDAKAKAAARKAVASALDLLDQGTLRVAEKSGGAWHVHQWLKKAVLLSFRLNDMTPIAGGPGGARWWDKVPSKFAGWGAAQFRKAGFRAVPGAWCAAPPSSRRASC